VKDLGSIHMAVDNLYNRCFVLGKEKQNKAKIQEIERIKSLPKEQGTQEMLTQLGTYYIDMREISKDAKDHPRKPQQQFFKAAPKKDNKDKAKAADKAAAAVEAANSAVDGAGASTLGAGEEGAERRGSVRQETRRKSIMSSEMSSARSSEVRPQSGNNR